MEKHELVQQMSKQMYRSFDRALTEALFEVRQENNRFWKQREEWEREWDKENTADWTKIRDSYHLKLKMIDEQIKLLNQMRTDAFEAMRKEEEEMWHKRAKAIAPKLETISEASEANHKKWREIEEAVIAKFETRLKAKATA